MSQEIPEFEFDRRWILFSAVAGTLWFGFTLVIIALLRIDQVLALLVAVIGSVLSGVGIVVYFVYVYDGPDQTSE